MINRYRVIFFIGRKRFSLLEFDSVLEIDGLILQSFQKEPLFIIEVGIGEFLSILSSLSLIESLKFFYLGINFSINYFFEVSKLDMIDINNTVCRVEKLNFHSEKECLQHLDINYKVQFEIPFMKN